MRTDMKNHLWKKAVTKATAVMAIVMTVGYGQALAEDNDFAQSLRGRVVAVGIRGASAISAVGKFLPGGPIHDKPAFAAFTQPGRILDPVRILVGSRSNFGAPQAHSDQQEGSFLSIDPSGAEMLLIP